MSVSAARFLPGLALFTALVAACAQGELKGGGGDECDRRADCDDDETCVDGECVPVGDQGQGGGNPYGYDACCVASNEPGCGAPTVEVCVCAFTDYCCTSAWDEGCAAAAVACGACSGSPTGAGPGVGASTTGVGVGASTSGAGVGASSTSGAGPSSSSTSVAASSSSSGGGGGGDCCLIAATPGCNDPAVESCVCGADIYCCDTAWDSNCVAAAGSCGAAGCGGGSSACCTAGSLGCASDLALEACVCGLDSYCCTTEWDSLCVDSAQIDCGATCP